MSLTCSKLYSDIPFAHRQPMHKGHCRLCHGHNWSFLFEFAANTLDECGFVVDFGKLQPLREFINHFDHATVLNADDPELDEFKRLEAKGLLRLVVVDDCSSEGLAMMMHQRGNEILRGMTNGRVRVVAVTCFEDSRNSAKSEGEL